MTKILIVNDNVHAGGAEKIMEGLAHYLAKNNYDVTIMTIKDDYESIVQFYPGNVKYYAMPNLYVDYSISYKRYDIRHIYNAIKRRASKKIYLNRINKGNYDVVIAMKEGDIMELLQDVNAKKKIGWIHTDYERQHWTAGLFRTVEQELQCMRKYDKLICVSQATYDSVRKTVGDSGNLVVRENPIDVKGIEKLSARKYKDKILKDKSLKDKSLKERNKTILVSVGRLCEHKNYMSLLKTMVKVRSVINKPYELWIIGDGEERNKLEDYAKEYGLSNVKFLGNKDNPYPYIKKADWFVTTTKGESYGLAVQEALILGVPVLATRCKAFEECVTENEAILVENTEDDIYCGLVKILGNGKLHSKYKEGIEERSHKKLYKDRLKEIEKLWCE